MIDAYVTLHELEAAGWSPADVRERCPWATEYADLVGRPCWLRDELARLLDSPDGGPQP
jgi:hypothetical protein